MNILLDWSKARTISKIKQAERRLAPYAEKASKTLGEVFDQAVLEHATKFIQEQTSNTVSRESPVVKVLIAPLACI